MTDNLFSLAQQYTLITHLQKKTKAYLTAINTALPSQLHQSTECCPLKMPTTETGETLGRTTFRTQPKSSKNPQQPTILCLRWSEKGEGEARNVGAQSRTSRKDWWSWGPEKYVLLKAVVSQELLSWPIPFFLSKDPHQMSFWTRYQTLVGKI